MRRVLPAAALAALTALTAGAAHATPAGSLTTIRIAPAPVAPLVRSEPAGDDVEEVAIRTRDDQTLAGHFYAPKKKGRQPAVILVHDAGSSSKSLVDIAETLQKRGLAVLSVDLRGHGGSVSDKCNWETSSQEEREVLWAFTMRDLEAATGYLRTREEVHTSNLSLVGVGSGAALAVRYAARNNNIQALVLIAPTVEGLGFQSDRDVAELYGLRTLIVTSNDDRKPATRLMEAGHKANDGIAFIDLVGLKADPGKELEDSRCAREIATWLRDEVVRGKGDR